MAPDTAPKEDCIRCDTIVTDNQMALYCELCCLWCHIKCLSISVSQYQALSSVTVPWFCKSCSKLSRGVVSDVNQLKTKVSKIEENIAAINSKVADESLEITINALVAKAVDVALPLAVSEALQKIPPPEQTAPITNQSLKSLEFRTVVYEQSREIIERDKRRQSIVVKGFGINPSNVQRSFSEMTHTLLNSPIHLADIVVVNNEMVRGKIFSEDKRRGILNCARDLKNHPLYSHVYINRDLTRQQRQEMYTRRQRLQLTQTPRNLPTTNQIVTGANSIPINTNRTPNINTNHTPITSTPIVSLMQLNVPPPVITTCSIPKTLPSQTRSIPSSSRTFPPPSHNIPPASHPSLMNPAIPNISPHHYNQRPVRRSRSTSPSYFPPVGLPVRTRLDY